MVFDYWKREDQFIAANKGLWLMIVILSMLNVFLAVAFFCQPNRIRVYIPPNIASGAVLKVNDIPDATVYAFAFQIFTATNTWSNSGTQDYAKNITRYKNYYSPSFISILNNDLNGKLHTGALSRKRLLTMDADYPYSPSLVKKIGNGTWQVDLKLNITETVNASTIKDVVMDYPLILTAKKTSIQTNPWGLVISGYAQEPYRIKTII